MKMKKFKKFISLKGTFNEIHASFHNNNQGFELSNIFDNSKLLVYQCNKKQQF